MAEAGLRIKAFLYDYLLIVAYLVALSGIGAFLTLGPCVVPGHLHSISCMTSASLGENGLGLADARVRQQNSEVVGQC